MSKSQQEQFDEALAYSTREEADAWLEQEALALLTLHRKDLTVDALQRAKELIRHNLGYWTGYDNDPAVWEKIYRLFDAEHPFFGTPEMRKTLTIEDAFAAGQLLAEQHHREDRDRG